MVGLPYSRNSRKADVDVPNCRRLKEISKLILHATHARAPYKVSRLYCLTRNGFDEAKCTRYVDALYACCQAFYKKNGDEATTVSCPKASLLRLKMKQREKAKQ